MAIEKLEDGRWFVDVEPIKGKRFRRKFKTKAEALRFESVCRSKTITDDDWSPKKKDSRKLNPHLEPIVLICLATGARWSEAHSVKPSSVQKNIITFSATKNGKVRAVPVAESLVAYLKAHWARFGSFSCSLSSFRRALVRTSIKLPKGQSAHALRHTFASHFVMNGGNILTLQKILGHSTVVMTMRYAHLSPDHLQDAIKLNPLGDFSK